MYPTSRIALFMIPQLMDGPVCAGGWPGATERGSRRSIKVAIIARSPMSNIISVATKRRDGIEVNKPAFRPTHPKVDQNLPLRLAASFAEAGRLLTYFMQSNTLLTNYIYNPWLHDNIGVLDNWEISGDRSFATGYVRCCPKRWTRSAGGRLRQDRPEHRRYWARHPRRRLWRREGEQQR
jgi:hypothetical protein